MKHLLYLILFVFIAQGSYAQVIPVKAGSTGNSYEYRGGLTADSAQGLPFQSPFKNKGIDTNRKIAASPADTLPSYELYNKWYKMLTTKDSGTYYVQPGQKGAALGVANLDGTGKVPISELPSLTASGQVYIDNSQAAMLGHTAATPGAFSVRTDSSNELFVLVTTPYNVRANWVMTTYTSAVLAFNGRVGVVVPAIGDYTFQTILQGGYKTNQNADFGKTASAYPYSSLILGYTSDSSGEIELQDTGHNGSLIIKAIPTSNQIIMTYGVNSSALTAGSNAQVLLSGLTNSIQYDTSFFTYSNGTNNSKVSFKALTTNNLDTIPNKSGTFALLSDVAVPKLQTTLLAGDSTNGSIFLSPNLTRSFSMGAGNGASVGIGFESDGSGWINLQDTTGTGGVDPYNLIGLKTGGIGGLNSDYAEIHVASGQYQANRQVGVWIYADTTGQSRIWLAGRNNGGNTYVNLDTAGISYVSSGGTNRFFWATPSGSHSDTIPNKTGTFAMLSDITSAGGLNSVLTNNPKSNQAILLGKALSTHPYSSVDLGLNADSSGYFLLYDTTTTNNAAILSANTATGAYMEVTNATGETVVSANTGVDVTFASGKNTNITTTGVNTFHLCGSGSAPTITAGSGAGTSSAVSVTGTDLGGYISVSTSVSGSPVANATVATITFAATFATAPRCIIITPANFATSALAIAGLVYVNQSSITTSGFTMTSGTTALNESNNYVWYYMIIK